jgi:NADH-quinone oxidoreductase subunit F
MSKRSPKSFMPLDLSYVDEAVERIGTAPDAAIPLLQALQTHYGYLPEAGLRRVCELTRIAPAALTGVASFYDMFRTRPAGQHLIRICHGTACHVAGAERVEDALRRHLRIPGAGDTDPGRAFTVEPVACLGCCTLAPVVKIGDQTFGHLTAEKVPGMLRDYQALAGNGGARSTEDVVARRVARAEIRIGLGSCCMAKGSDQLYYALRESVERSGADVAVKRVGCVGMCHRTPLVEVSAPGQSGVLYEGLDASGARALVRERFARPGWLQRARRAWNRALDFALTETAEEPAGCGHALDRKEREVSAFLDRQVHIATEGFGKADPLDLEEYVHNGGFEALRQCLANAERGTPSAKQDRIIATVERSGLRGRGGAGFPTGRKWRVVADQPGDTKYVICNGDEGDPGAFMDRMILESFPFRIIEGLAIAAVAVGAHEGIFYIRHEYPLAVKRVRAAIKMLQARGWLGAKLLGVGKVERTDHRDSVVECASPLALSTPPADPTTFSKQQKTAAVQNLPETPATKGTGYAFNVRIVEGAGAFVCGEETALIASVEGKRGMPRLRPPFPAQEGLWGKPTLINNVETLALVPWILRHGADKFAAYGTRTSQGTKVFALAGKIRRAGLIEIPMGTTIREIVEEIGGGVEPGRRFKAVQIGGPSGGCVPARLVDTPVDFESLREVGAIMGSGGLVVLDDTACMVDMARYFLQFTQNQSCGKCTFCRVGTRRMLDILDRLCAGKGAKGDLETLETLAHQVGAGSLCGLGKTAPNPVLSTLRYFRDEYEAHLAGRCPAGQCTPLIHYRITDQCIGCTLCAQHCPVNAIPMTPYARHAVLDAQCTRCDACRRVCPEGAVEVR